jgi:hypothetical protein
VRGVRTHGDAYRHRQDAERVAQLDPKAERLAQIASVATFALVVRSLSGRGRENQKLPD